MVEDWAWHGPDDVPGCGVTLALLYYLVPVTEEVDLLEDLDHEREEARWHTRDAEFLPDGEDDDIDDHGQEQPEDLADPPMSLGQVIGMLRHLLGAEIVDDENQPPESEV